MCIIAIVDTACGVTDHTVVMVISTPTVTRNIIHQSVSGIYL